MKDFNISFIFTSSLGLNDDGTARLVVAEQRWSGVTVTVSESAIAKLSTKELRAVLEHECIHAIWGYTA